mgnify:FL=1
MDLVSRLLKELSVNDKDSIYLREIALLMEQMDELKANLEVKENLIKNYQKELQRQKWDKLT